MTISFSFFSKPQNNKIVFQCKHGFQPNYVADANGHVHLVSQQENKAEQRSPCKSNLITCCMACTQSTESEKTDLSVLTNKCCRYMFPISFAIFNLVYWLALSTGNWHLIGYSQRSEELKDQLTFQCTKEGNVRRWRR